jgi:hypothetical protein
MKLVLIIFSSILVAMGFASVAELENERLAERSRKIVPKFLPLVVLTENCFENLDHRKVIIALKVLCDQSPSALSEKWLLDLEATVRDICFAKIILIF